jgi:hypothetical protein
MNDKICVKIFNNNDKIKYEWREIDSEIEIKNLIDTLSDKGMENFNNKVLNYINYSNPLRNIENNKTKLIQININKYDLIYDRLYKLEENITK